MSWLLSIFTGLSIRAWLIIAAVAAFAIWSFHVYNVGYSVADGMWKAKALEARITKLELEIKLQHDADAEEDRLRSDLEAENEQQKKVIDDFLAELKNRPDKCLLGPDAERLQ